MGTHLSANGPVFIPWRALEARGALKARGAHVASFTREPADTIAGAVAVASRHRIGPSIATDVDERAIVDAIRIACPVLCKPDRAVVTVRSNVPVFAAVAAVPSESCLAVADATRRSS